MQCSEVMKRPVQFVLARDRVRDAARKMRELDIGFLPVCDKTGHVVGTVTDRDIAVRCCADNLSAKKTRVGEVMSLELVACLPEDELRRAQELMVAHQKSRVIIADSDEHLLGVVSLSDIAVYLPPFAAETVSAVAARESKAPSCVIPRVEK